MKIIKRSGAENTFDKEKIENAVAKANITVEEKEKTVLENLAETDFNSTEKRQAFLSYGEKAKNQNVLLIKDIGRKEDRLKELKENISDTEKRIKELESNIVTFPKEAEESKPSKTS